MKKSTLFKIFLLFFVTIGYGQQYQVPTCLGTVASNSHGPMYSTATANATSRTAVVYPASQLGGIAGQTLSGVYFSRLAATGEMAGTPNFKVYLKETADPDFGAGGLSWATVVTGATLVYNSDPTVSVGSSAGWKSFPFSANYTYSGTQNLIVLMEYSNTSALTTSITWEYEFQSPCITTSNTNTTKYSNNNTGTLAETLTTNEYRRPFIGFDFVVSCNAPNTVVASNITTTTAEINWVPNTIAPSSGHEYFLSTTNTAPLPSATPTGSIPTGNTLNLSTLEINTQYYIWVRANCGVVDGVSTWIPGSFRTACGEVATFTEVFEGLPTGTSSPMPPCWAKAGAGAVYVTTGSVAPMSPANRLYMTASGTTPTESYAILPAVSNLQANTHRLKFKAYSSSGSDRTLDLGYVTDVDNIASYVWLQTVNLPGTAAGTATEFIIYPGVLPVGVSHLVIKNPGHPGGVNTCYIDDVIWEQSPTCLEVSNVTTTLITENSAQINWTNGQSETAWDIEYGAPGFALGTGTSVPGIATNPYVLTSLTPNTVYEFYIRAVCSVSDQSPWEGPYVFKTLCATVTDYIVNFEGLPTGTGNLPDCWSKLGTSANVYTTTASVAPMSPPNRLYMNISATTTAFALMTPVSNLQANTHKLKFKAYATTANKILQVGYFTNPTDVATFVSIEDFQMPSTTAATAVEFELIPTTVPAGVTQLVFGLVAGTATTIYIDDVVWEVNSPCMQPTSLNASAITFESAVLDWANGGVETQWDIEYGLQNFQLGTGTQLIGVTNNPYTLNGLLPITNYQYYVRAVCSGNIPSSWSGPYNFKTACTDFALYTQNFEGIPTGTTSPMPDCWSKLGNGSTYPTTGSVAPMSPPNRLYMFASATATPATEIYAILPGFSNLQANTHRLKFKAYATIAGRFLEFGYFLDASDISTFVMLQEVFLPGTTAATAQEFIVTPGALPAGVKNLAFKNPGFPGGSTTAYLDDFIWEAIPSCLEPSNLFASQFSQNSASLSWTASASAETAWDIEYGTPGFVLGTGTLVSGVNSNPYLLGGLTENTSYEFYVRAVCGVSDSSVWIGPYEFKTLCTPVSVYAMNFEGQTTGSGNLPDCWSKAGSSANVYTSTSSVAPMSPPNRLYMNISATSSAYALLPPFSNIQANTHRLKFKTYATTANKILQVGYFTNAPDVSTFVAIEDIQLPSTTAVTAQEFVVTPNNIPVGVSQLVFTIVQGAATTLYMDDIVWEAIPSCAEPTLVTVTDILATTATLNWTASVSAPANGYEYYLATSSTSPDAATVATGSVGAGITTASLTTLTPNTLYYVWVRSVCSVSESSIWSFVASFSTLCAPTVPDYTEDFATFLPACWNEYQTGTVATGPTGSPGLGSWVADGYLNVGTTGAAKINIYSVAPTGTGWLVSPVFDLSAGGYEIKFNVGATDFANTNPIEAPGVMGSDDFLYVLMSVDGGTTWTILETYSATNTPTHLGASEVYDISTVNSPTVLFAFYGTSGSVNDGVDADYFIDNFAVELVDLSTGNFDSANFKFYPNPVNDILTVSYSNVISEIVVYNLLGQQVLTTKPNTTQTQVDLSNLNAGTYMVKVTSDEVTKTVKVVKN